MRCPDVGINRSPRAALRWVGLTLLVGVLAYLITTRPPPSVPEKPMSLADPRLLELVAIANDWNHGTLDETDPMPLRSVLRKFVRSAGGSRMITCWPNPALTVARLYAVTHEVRQPGRRILLERWVSNHFTRAEAITWWTRHASFGGPGRGVEQAARYFYERPVATLSTAELVTLVAGEQVGDSNRLADRRKYLLRILEESGRFALPSDESLTVALGPLLECNPSDFSSD